MITARDANGKLICAVDDNGNRATEGYCPCCKKRLIAKVGDVRRPHWAHPSSERCDEWWEGESDWHMTWKERFLEIPNVDVENVKNKDGVRHFYDVCFNHKQIAILRRKKLSDSQLKEREFFFGDMFWMVGGSSREYECLLEACRSKTLRQLQGADNKYVKTFFCHCDKTLFFRRWMNCSKPVVFDFENTSEGECTDLWCVLPCKLGELRFVVSISRDDFISRLNNYGGLFKIPVENVVKCLLGKKNETEQRIGNLAAVPAVPIQDRRVLSGQGTSELSQYKEVPAVVPMEELVKRYERCGFSKEDAVARAKLEFEKQG